jgi:hypothetical protein
VMSQQCTAYSTPDLRALIAEIKISRQRSWRRPDRQSSIHNGPLISTPRPSRLRHDPFGVRDLLLSVYRLKSRPLTFPSNGLNGFVEALEKAGSVAVLEGSGATCYRSEFTKVGQQRPTCKGLAYGILSEPITAWTEYKGPFVEATRSQRDIPRNHNVVRRDMLNNPVIDSVEMSLDNDELDPLPIGNANPRVGNHGNVESIPLRHAVHFLLYGAPIGVDEQIKHLGPLPGGQQHHSFSWLPDLHEFSQSPRPRTSLVSRRMRLQSAQSSGSDWPKQGIMSRSLDCHDSVANL